MKMTTFGRMLDSIPPQILSHGPLNEFCFNLTHPAGDVQWEVAEGVLTANINGQVFQYDVESMTLGYLTSALTTSGFIVSDLDPLLVSYPATVIPEGVNNSSRASVPKFNSLLFNMLGAYAKELRKLRNAIPNALKQLVIPSSSGIWLSMWGRLYKIDRLDGMTDEDFAKYIPEEAFRIRVNARAIEKAVKDILGYDILITEPWTEMFTLDVSQLSGTHRFHNGTDTGYCLIKPVSFGEVDWSKIMPIIYRNKAAGVLVLTPDVLTKVGAIKVWDSSVFFALRSVHPKYLQMDDSSEALSDSLTLSGGRTGIYAYQVIRNRNAMEAIGVAFNGTVRVLGRRDITMDEMDFSISTRHGFRHDRAYCSGARLTAWSHPGLTWEQGSLTWGAGEVGTHLDLSAALFHSQSRSTDVSRLKMIVDLTPTRRSAKATSAEARFDVKHSLGTVHYSTLAKAGVEAMSFSSLRRFSDIQALSLAASGGVRYKTKILPVQLALDVLARARTDHMAAASDAGLKLYASRNYGMDKDGHVLTWLNANSGWGDFTWNSTDIPPSLLH